MADILKFPQNKTVFWSNTWEGIKSKMSMAFKLAGLPDEDISNALEIYQKIFERAEAVMNTLMVPLLDKEYGQVDITNPEQVNQVISEITNDLHQLYQDLLGVLFSETLRLCFKVSQFERQIKELTEKE